MHEDTVHLLGDCAAGIEMAVNTMDSLLPEIKDRTLRQKVRGSIDDHHRLHDRTRALLDQYGGQVKSPGAMAKSMAWLKTNTRMALKADDTTAAYLVADGCDIGVKSLSRSRNRYAGADQAAVDLAQSLIRCEEALSAGMRPYL